MVAVSSGEGHFGCHHVSPESSNFFAARLSIEFPLTAVGFRSSERALAGLDLIG